MRKKLALVTGSSATRFTDSTGAGLNCLCENYDSRCARRAPIVRPSTAIACTLLPSLVRLPASLLPYFAGNIWKVCFCLALGVTDPGRHALSDRAGNVREYYECVPAHSPTARYVLPKRS